MSVFARNTAEQANFAAYLSVLLLDGQRRRLSSRKSGIRQQRYNGRWVLNSGTVPAGAVLHKNVYRPRTTP